MGVAGELTVVVTLALANGLFAGAEIAMLAVRKSQLLELAEHGDRSARTALALRAHPERFLATVQVGITVIGATAAAFGGASLARRAATLLRGLGLSPDLADELSLAAVIAFVSYVSLVLGELVPKSLALRYAERFTRLSARPLAAIATVARPMIWFLTASSNLVLRLFGDRTSFAESRLSPEELHQLLEEGATAGTVDRRAGDIAMRALDVIGLSVDAVKVPRSDIVALRRDDLRGELVAALRHTPHARYPVIGHDLDDAIGFIVVRDAAALLVEPGNDLGAIVRPAWFVPESRPALEVLDAMQKAGTPLALLVDELGTVTGLATIEDLLEELVGEIRDATRRETPLIEWEGDASIVVSGRMPVHDLNRAADLSLRPGPGFTTIGGLVVARARRIPKNGTVLVIDDAKVEVLDATTRRVLKVRITRRTAGD